MIILLPSHARLCAGNISHIGSDDVLRSVWPSAHTVNAKSLLSMNFANVFQTSKPQSNL